MHSAGIRRVDRDAVTAAVERWARALGARPEVARIVWYGSFLHGVPTSRSDADLCVVVDDAAAAGVPRHARGADYLPTWATPVPLDLAVLTAGEFDALPTWAPAWHAAISAGRVLYAGDDASAAAGDDPRRG